MKSWLFALGLALCCVVQANEEKADHNLDLSKIPGSWIVGVVVTNCQKMKEMIPYMNAFYVSFVVESENQVNMKVDMLMKQGCQTMKLNLTRENGHFTAICQGVKKTVEASKVSDDAMFTSIVVSEEKCKVVTLAVKRADDIQSKMEELNTFAGGVGLGAEKPNILPTKGMCPLSS